MEPCTLHTNRERTPLGEPEGSRLAEIPPARKLKRGEGEGGGKTCDNLLSTPKKERPEDTSRMTTGDKGVPKECSLARDAERRGKKKTTVRRGVWNRARRHRAAMARRFQSLPVPLLRSFRKESMTLNTKGKRVKDLRRLKSFSRRTTLVGFYAGLQKCPRTTTGPLESSHASPALSKSETIASKRAE